uniref:Uncharacterized protein LOC116951692 isoform X1 n=1 Tax=Petromyzon marinus TaxID=7757 RepID=A0AAJ7X9E3_PETMA|nr:uncharacterized protein LOC116951692 isoform X1 [Petromyzon marinus]
MGRDFRIRYLFLLPALHPTAHRHATSASGEGVTQSPWLHPPPPPPSSSFLSLPPSCRRRRPALRPPAWTSSMNKLIAFLLTKSVTFSTCSRSPITLPPPPPTDGSVTANERLHARDKTAHLEERCRGGGVASCMAVLRTSDSGFCQARYTARARV